MQFYLFHSDILPVPKDIYHPLQTGKKHINKQPDGEEQLIHTTPSQLKFLFRITPFPVHLLCHQNRGSGTVFRLFSKSILKHSIKSIQTDF